MTEKKTDKRTQYPNGRREYEKGIIFGKIQQTLADIERKLKANCEAHEKILRILQGDDKDGGVCTQVAVNTRSIKWIWSLISALALGLVLLFLKVIME